MKDQDFLPLNPKKLISLRDMNEFLRFEFNVTHTGILLWQETLLQAAVKSDQKGKISPEERAGILAALDDAKARCRKLELANSLHIIWQIQSRARVHAPIIQEDFKN